MESIKIKNPFLKVNFTVALVTVVFLHVTSGPAWSQVTISSNTIMTASSATQITLDQDFNNQSAIADFSNINLILSSGAARSLNTIAPLTVNGLKLDGSGVYTVNGQLTVSQSLILNNGVLKIDAAAANPGILVYAGTDDIAPGSATSYIDGLLTMHAYGNGPRTFPIGNSSGYFPVRLEDVKDNLITLSFEAIDGDPSLSSTPSDVLDVFKSHYWQMGVAGTFTGSPISISTTGTDNFIAAAPPGIPIVIEKDADGKIKNLSGTFVSPYITSSNPVSSKATVVAIGKANGEILPVIINVVTPNEDGVNDYIVIRNIEFFTDNEVTFLDRYGVPIFSKSNFKNYATADEARADYDFSRLSNGNYICTLRYGREGKKIAQMITVLK